MIYEYVDLHLADEIPKLGQGRRRVIVRIGRKLVTIFDPFGGRRKVISKKFWGKLSSEVITTDPNVMLKVLSGDVFKSLIKELKNEVVKERVLWTLREQSTKN